MICLCYSRNLIPWGQSLTCKLLVVCNAYPYFGEVLVPSSLWCIVLIIFNFIFSMMLSSRTFSSLSPSFSPNWSFFWVNELTISCAFVDKPSEFVCQVQLFMFYHHLSLQGMLTVVLPFQLRIPYAWKRKIKSGVLIQMCKHT